MDIVSCWDVSACVWSCVVVRECAVCFCAALCLLGVSEEQKNRCYSWSLGVRVSAGEALARYITEHGNFSDF